MRNPINKEMNMSGAKQNTCETRIDSQLRGRLCDLRRLWAFYQHGDEWDDDLGSPRHYGLSFDYVPAGTFSDQREGYFRYQLSWGGPSDEFRFFVNPDLSCHRIEYWFMDWFDGACRVIDADDYSFMIEIWQWFADAGAVRSAMQGISSQHVRA
jgi:hypothetical protein